MSTPENKGILAPPKNSVLYKRSQRTLFFAGLNKEQYPKTDISDVVQIIA
jgi:hypothetical protein